jgi:hypothetical protein
MAKVPSKEHNQDVSMDDIDNIAESQQSGNHDTLMNIDTTTYHGQQHTIMTATTDIIGSTNANAGFPSIDDIGTINRMQ